MEMIVADSRARQVVETIATTARSGKIGDGKIFVSTVDEAIRIRSGEEGETIL
jgi:nitrogen regulatory protein P-II 1